MHLSSRYFDTRSVFPPGYFVGKRVVEVGAGCGLTSILLALLGADVTITDMDTGNVLFWIAWGWVRCDGNRKG